MTDQEKVLRESCLNPRKLVPWAMGLLLAGCSHTVPLQVHFEQPARTRPLPIGVGVYYSPELRSYTHVGARGDTWVSHLGPASVRLFDQVFPLAFSRTRPVRERPAASSANPPGLDAVIEPRIEDFDFALPFLKSGVYTAQITYRFVLYSGGDPIISWVEKGFAAQRGEPGYDFTRGPADAAELAMRDAATKFLTSLQTNPEVKRWLDRMEGRGS